MGNDPRLTAPTLKVLGMLMSRLDSELSGAEIARSTKLASGTLYPILLRLEQAKWTESRWETEDAGELGRPRRRLYRLTGAGEKKVKKAFKEIASAIGEFVWS